MQIDVAEPNNVFDFEKKEEEDRLQTQQSLDPSRSFILTSKTMMRTLSCQRAVLFCIRGCHCLKLTVNSSFCPNSISFMILCQSPTHCVNRFFTFRASSPQC